MKTGKEKRGKRQERSKDQEEVLFLERIFFCFLRVWMRGCQDVLGDTLPSLDVRIKLGLYCFPDDPIHVSNCMTRITMSFISIQC
jgi:hypothetical protein